MNYLKIEGTRVHVFPDETAKARTLTDQGIFEELFIQLMTADRETDEKAAFEKTKVPEAIGKSQLEEEEPAELEKRAFEAFQNGFLFLPLESWTREPALSTGKQSSDATENETFPAETPEIPEMAGMIEISKIPGIAGTAGTIQTVETTGTAGTAKLSMEKAGETGTAYLLQQRLPALKDRDDVSLDHISFFEREPFQALVEESTYLQGEPSETAAGENWLKAPTETPIQETREEQTGKNEQVENNLNILFKNEEQKNNQNQLLFSAQEQQRPDQKFVQTEKTIKTDKIEKENLQLSNLPVLLMQSPEETPFGKQEHVSSARTIIYQHPEQLVKEVENTIQLSFHSAEKNTGHRVQIKLVPESMGKMEIHLEWHQDQVAAKIFVQEKEVKELLDQQFPKLWQGLHPSGPTLPLPEISIQLLPEQSAAFQSGQDFGQRKPGAGFSFSKGSHLHSKQEQEEEPGEQPVPALRGLSIYI